MNKRHNPQGYTLMEILVVVLIFSILGLVVTGVVSTTLRSSGKSENAVLVRENVNYAMGVLERNLRNADTITGCNATSLQYITADGNPEEYECSVSGGIGSLVSSSLSGDTLTSSKVSVHCEEVFNCPPPPIDYVDITILATDSASVTGSVNALTADYSETVRVKIRNEL